MPRWSEARAIDWSAFPGAYGTKRDVAIALETLRWASDFDDDDFADALDLLQSHAWHQGTIYPLTPKVLPFVFDIVDQSPALAEDEVTRREVATFVLLCASSAIRATDSEDGNERAIGRAVLSVLSGSAARLEAWERAGLGDVAVPTMLNVPELRDRLLAGARADRAQLLGIVLGATKFLGPVPLMWAASELSGLGHPVAERAAAILYEASDPNKHLDGIDADRLAVLGRKLLVESDVTAALDSLRQRMSL